MKSTESGIRLMIYVFILMIAANVILLLGAAFGAGIPDESVMESSMETSLFFGFIFIVLGIIVFLMAIYNFIKDSGNRGGSHENDVKYAAGLFLAGFVFGAVFFPIQNLFYILGAVFLVKSLGEDIERNLLYSGAGINLLGTVGAFMFFTYGAGKHLNDTVLFALIGWITISFIIGFLFFMISYKRIENRLRVGDPTIEYPIIGHLGSSEDFVEAGKKCPRCGRYNLTVYDDGSARCSNCGYSTSRWGEGEYDE